MFKHGLDDKTMEWAMFHVFAIEVGAGSVNQISRLW